MTGAKITNGDYTFCTVSSDLHAALKTSAPSIEKNCTTNMAGSVTSYRAVIYTRKIR